MHTHETTTDEVGLIVAEVLAVEPEEVHPSSRFFEDLGGESIDFLDLSFKLERRFGVRMQLQAMAGSNNLPADEQGRLTPEGLARLKSDYPFLDYGAFEADPRLSRFTELITVEAIARFVQQAVARKVTTSDTCHKVEGGIMRHGAEGELSQSPGG